jgi:two-component system, NarL family, response regulator YdfI
VIRVFIVAASPLARAGLQDLLVARGVDVVGSAASVDSVNDRAPDAEVGVLLIDASGDNSESILASVEDSDLALETSIVLLTDRPGGVWSTEVLGAGVRAILPADVPPDQLVAALQAASAGLVVLHPSDVNAALPAAATATSQSLAELTEPLTRREREVLQMLAAGLGNKEIAARLNISDHTAKFHVASILGKLGAATRTEAVSLGIRRGLILL